MSTPLVWRFDLYIAGVTPKTQRVYNNLQRICKAQVRECQITVSDLQKNPQIAIDNQITATPTVIRRYPLPERILIGDLTDVERVASAFDLRVPY